MTEKVLSVILMVVIVGAIGALGYVIATPKVEEKFTDFYILGPEGRPGHYPEELKLGEGGRVIMGIVNHEQERTDYKVEVWIDGEKAKLRIEGEDRDGGSSSGAPLCENDLFTYNPSTGEITKKHDFLNDSDHYSKIFTSPCSADGSWSSDDAATILYDNGTFYIIHRLRCPPTSENPRGYQMECHHSTDLVTWTKDWDVHIDDVLPSAAISFESSSLRKYGNYYYLYFCCDPGDPYFNTYYIKSTTIAGLESQLTDSSNWVTLLSNESYRIKDPRVHYLDGTYYMTVNAGGEACLYSSSSPEGPFSQVCSLQDAYDTKYGSGNHTGDNAGVITYDSSSSYYIYWGKLQDANDSKFYWYWAVSQNMASWAVVDREEISSERGGRYPDYHAVDGEHIILIMGWDDDDDDVENLFIWKYGEELNIQVGGSSDDCRVGYGDAIEVELEHEQEWEKVVGFVPQKTGEEQKVEFVLYKDGETYFEEQLYLWIDVEEVR